jgi:hypothetical protein
VVSGKRDQDIMRHGCGVPGSAARGIGRGKSHGVAKGKRRRGVGARGGWDSGAGESVAAELEGDAAARVAFAERGEGEC